MKKLKQTKGITLIALVITIIVLLILAGIAINLTLGQNGVIRQSQNAGIIHEQAAAREKLELLLLDLQADKLTKPEYNENEYINSYLEEKGMQVEGNIVIVDGWQFEIDRSVPKIAQELGKLIQEELQKPAVTNLETTVGYTEISVSIGLRDAENTNVVCILKKVETDEEIERTQNLEYTFSNLEMGKQYEIIVQASNEYGTVTKTKTETTKRIVLVSSIQLSETKITLYMNQTKELTYTIGPADAKDKTVTWSSSNEGIAKVENGVITPISSGECTITCASNDGGAQATCNVSVINGSVIYTVTDLKGINNKLSGSYILANDIDLEGVAWTSLGDAYNLFTGTLDGNGYSIKNLTSPLFSYIKGATIKNIKFEDVSIITSSSRIGAIAIYGQGNVTLTNVGVTGKITGNESVAGLVAAVDSGILTATNCYVRADVEGSGLYTAGLVPNQYGVGNVATLNSCYYAGNIRNNNVAKGPLVNKVDAFGNIVMPACTINNCYYNSDLYTDTVPNGGGTGLGTALFANASNFSGWDFENTWVIKDGYPELKIFIK